MNKSIALYLLLAGLLTGFSCTHTKQQPEEEGVDSEWLDSLQHVYQYGVCIDSLDVTEYKMKNGDNPAAIFSALGFSALKADSITKASIHVLDPTKLRAGMNYYTFTTQDSIADIRYIAFEAGILGHKPDTPAEVLRKRYGDCKGMAILLRTLLKAQGFDARLTDIGTVDIPYRMSEIATLASVNHMICSLIYQGKTYYLDATNEYINAEFIPESIQGREAVIENGENCIVHTLPMLNSSASTDSLSYICSLSDKQTNKVLQGNVTRSWSGDMKEFFLTAYHENDKSGRKEYLPRILTGDNHNYQINSVSWIQQEPQQEWAALTGEVINSSAVQIADNEFYIELDLHNDLFDQPIDTAKRIHDYELPLRCRIVRHTELEIPAGYVLSYCPKGISIHTPQGILCCSYKTEGNKIIFRKIMEITEKRIPRNEITIWNTHLRKWADASHEQIILKKQ